MVVFTCNHCGDSLQKPRVEKHYMMNCRTAKSLTCMDCLKDFRGEDYVEHTKCVTEIQRYSAKGSVVQAPKKGEIKQDNWTNLIKDIILNNPKLPAHYLNQLQALSSVNNVPRKKEKFVRFMKSSDRTLNQNHIDGLWTIIQEHKEKFAEGNQENISQAEVSNSKQKENSVSQNENVVAKEAETSVENGRKKSKKRSSKVVEDDVQSEPVEHVLVQAEDDVKTVPETKKKRKKNKKNQSKSNGVTTEDNAVTEVEENSTNAQREGNSDNVELVLEAPSQDAVVTKRKGKKRKIGSNSSTVENGSQELKNTDASDGGKTSKKKKAHPKDDDTIVEVHNENVDKAENVCPEQFSLRDKILDVLKPKGSIALNKLQKKVLSAYKKAGSLKPEKKIHGKLLKTLKKMNNIEINDDNVKLVLA